MAITSRLPSICVIFLLCTVVASGQDVRAPNMFKDLEQSHWAYQAVDGLRSRNIVGGYPEGYFRGKRTLTRYEFAVAVDRALKVLAGRSDDSLLSGQDLSVTSRDIDTLRRLTREFHDELASLGGDEKAMAQVLDRAARLTSQGASPGRQPAPSGTGRTAAAPIASLSGDGANPTALFRSLPLNPGLLGPAPAPRLTLFSLCQKLGSSTLANADAGVNASSLLDQQSSDVAGARVNTKVGRLTLQAFYGDLIESGAVEPGWNAILAEAAGQPKGFALSGGPAGRADIAAGDGRASRTTGITGAIGFGAHDNSGHLRLSALTVNDLQNSDGSGARDVTVFGATSDLRLARRLTLSAEWSRSISGSRLTPASQTDSDAFNAIVGYNGAGLNVSAGYRYVDPLFYTPGYWGRIGNWQNPTNIQGPTFRASYDLSPSIGLTFGGDYYTAARDSSPLGLDTNEEITRALLGVRWGLSKTLNLTADYEGVFWSLNGSRGAGSGMFHPTEHYITLGTGFNITGSTLLRFNYQIGDLDGHGALNYGSSSRSKYSAFVGQVNVKF